MSLHNSVWFVVCDANFVVLIPLGFELCIQGLLQEAFQFQEGQGWLLEMVCWKLGLRRCCWCFIPFLRLLPWLCSYPSSKWRKGCKERCRRKTIQWSYWCLQEDIGNWWYCWPLPWFQYLLCRNHRVSWSLLWNVWFLEASSPYWISAGLHALSPLSFYSTKFFSSTNLSLLICAVSPVSFYSTKFFSSTNLTLLICILVHVNIGVIEGLIFLTYLSWSTNISTCETILEIL